MSREIFDFCFRFFIAIDKLIFQIKRVADHSTERRIALRGKFWTKVFKAI